MSGTPRLVEGVGEAVGEDGLHARVREDDLVETGRGGVAVEGRADVVRDDVGNRGESLEEARRDFRRARRGAAGVVRRERFLDLIGQPEVDPEQDVRQVVAQVRAIEDRLAEKAGVHDFLQETQDLDDLAAAGPRRRVHGGEEGPALRAGDDAVDRVAAAGIAHGTHSLTAPTPSASRPPPPAPAGIRRASPAAARLRRAPAGGPALRRAFPARSPRSPRRGTRARGSSSGPSRPRGAGFAAPLSATPSPSGTGPRGSGGGAVRGSGSRRPRRTRGSRRMTAWA